LVNSSNRPNPIYADQNYLELKLYWFLKLHYHREHPLAIWGAGKKGKFMARYFLKQDCDFHWITNNSKKQGVNIYEQVLASPEILDTHKDLMILVAVATPSARTEIEDFLTKKNKQRGKDYFWFC